MESPPRRSRLLIGVGIAALAIVAIGYVATRFPSGLGRSETVTGVTETPGAEILILTELPLAGRLGDDTPVPTVEEPAPTLTGNTPPTLSGPLSEIVDEKGVAMIFIPEGDFIMGSSYGDPDEVPIHSVHLDSYYIDKFEVTNALYQDCVDAGVCKPPIHADSFTRSSYYGNAQYDTYPVVYVDWSMANNYCAWRGAHLPTEAQWEKAARGTDERIFPWGRDLDCQKANSQGCFNGTSQVGSYESGKSPFGVYDMAGNVWEWIADWYSAEYYENSPPSNPLGPATGGARVLRGGSWNRPPHNLRVSNRVNYAPTYYNFDIGFRCARSLP